MNDAKNVLISQCEAFFGAGGAFLTSSKRKGEKRRGELSKASDPLMLFF